MVFIPATEVSSRLKEASRSYWYIVSMESDCDNDSFLLKVIEE